MEEKNNIVIYQLEDGKTKIDVKLEDETVWLSQQQMADLYDTTKQNISSHIKNIFDEEELIENSTVKEFLTVQKEGNPIKRAKSNLWYVFIPNNCEKTLAEMSDEERKNRNDGHTSATELFAEWYQNIYLKQNVKKLLLL